MDGLVPFCAGVKEEKRLRKNHKTLEMSGWDSFWDLSDPQSVSEVMTDIYGAAAASAATECAAAAGADGRVDDYQFWIRTRSMIEATQASRRRMVVAWWNANGLSEI